MAEAKMVVPEPVPTTVVLTLTLEEAEVVKAVIGAATGHGQFVDVSSRVYDALDKAGVDKDDSVYFSSGVQVSYVG